MRHDSIETKLQDETMEELIKNLEFLRFSKLYCIILERAFRALLI